MIDFKFSEDGLSACVEGRKKFDDGSLYGTLKVMDGAGELIWAHRGNWADAAVREAASAKIASISANSIDSLEADLLRLYSLLDEEPAGDNSLNSFANEPEWPKPIDEAAYSGPIGEIVRTLAPETEADPAALMFHAIVLAGNALGPTPHQRVGRVRHRSQTFAVLVGESSKSRKGNAEADIRDIFYRFDSDYGLDHITTGLASGEGLIWAVRDPIEKQEPVKEKGLIKGYQTVVIDPGVEDKRLTVIEPEFAKVLQVMGREGNILSAVVRQAWDTGNLRTMTKNSPAVATGAHISIIGHITKDELLQSLATVQMVNGFANRFMWAAVRRSKELPDGGFVEDEVLDALASKIRKAVRECEAIGQIVRDDDAKQMWHEVYHDLSADKPGLAGAVCSRAEAQVTRLSGVYALMDGSRQIRAEHMSAALAVWDYVEASARYIFGDKLGDPIADRILSHLRRRATGLSRTEISTDIFNKNTSAGAIDQALHKLHALGLASFQQESSDGDSAGRPKEMWYATR